MSKLSGNTQMTGMFQFSEKRRLPGTLSLDGPNTMLHLWDEDESLIDEPHDETISGTLGDQKLVTMLGCILTGRETNFGQSGTANHYYIFPHYVIIGGRSVFKDSADIENISFVFEDAPNLFRDMESFQMKPRNTEDTRTLIRSLNPEKEIHVGKTARVAYYTGKEEIFSSNTELGRITVRHSPIFFDLRGPKGIRIDNRIVAQIDFPQPLALRNAISRMYRSISFFGLIMGRVQNVRDISICRKGDDLLSRCDVHTTMYPRYGYSTNEFGSGFHNPLVDGMRDALLLSSIARKWLQRDTSWQTARSMMLSGWNKIRSYNTNRLVNAANMYDFLPKDSFPQDYEINEDLILAVQEAREIFKALLNDMDRNSALGALSRVGTLTLKGRICFRAEVVSQLIGNRIPGIEKVVNEAVDLRNHYVHGSPTAIDYSQNLNLEIFLTNTLEFVFAASDLVDAGWNICDWIKRESHMHHPFGIYIKNYLKNYEELESFRQRVNR